MHVTCHVRFVLVCFCFNLIYFDSFSSSAWVCVIHKNRDKMSFVKWKAIFQRPSIEWYRNFKSEMKNSVKAALIAQFARNHIWWNSECSSIWKSLLIHFCWYKVLAFIRSFCIEIAWQTKWQYMSAITRWAHANLSHTLSLPLSAATLSRTHYGMACCYEYSMSVLCSLLSALVRSVARRLIIALY